MTVGIVTVAATFYPAELDTQSAVGVAAPGARVLPVLPVVLPRPRATPAPVHTENRDALD
jgi:hypothetical protein